MASRCRKALSVSVRKGELENVERNRDKSLGVTLLPRAAARQCLDLDFSPDAIRRTVQAAYDIARFTAEDPVAGLPDEQDIADDYPDLDLFHPWAISAEEAARSRCAARLRRSRPAGRSATAGGDVSAQQSHFFTEHMRGGERGCAGIFRGGCASSRHSFSVAPIAGAARTCSATTGSARCVRRPSWPAPRRSGATRPSALARLKPRQVATTECPVLFEAPLAPVCSAGFIRPSAVARCTARPVSCSTAWATQVFPDHIDILEDPHLRGGRAAPLRRRGRAHRATPGGRGRPGAGLFLSTYSARKLGMRTTGNAGGSHNLHLSSRLTQPGDDLDAMLRKLGTGLFVTELMGQGVNYVTGDYSRGASGFWVENGQIAFPVQEITIAGNLRQMFQDLVAVGSDVYGYGGKNVGSILVSRMKLAGS